MGIINFIKLFKQTSMFLLKCQERVLSFQLNVFFNKNKKYLKYSRGGCSVSINSGVESKKEYLNNEIKNILKQYKNDYSLILDYINKNNTKVFKMNNAKKILSMFGEEPGLITSRTGVKAIIINLILFKKIGFKTEPLFMLENENPDIYYLIQQFHRWYFMKNSFGGFDEKSQELLKQINNGNEDNIISKLKPDDISTLQQAISRDVEAINFVVQYAKETAGSKQALEKIKTGAGANI